MDLVFHAISQDHMMKDSCDFMDEGDSLIVSHHPVKFSSHKYYNCGDEMFLVIEEQDSTCSLTSSITISKAYDISCFHERNFR